MPFVQVCHHGLKRQRGHWSIELFQSKRCAIQLAAERSGRKAGSSKGKWRDDKEKGYQEQSQSSWGKQKWPPDEEDADSEIKDQPKWNEKEGWREEDWREGKEKGDEESSQLKWKKESWKDDREKGGQDSSKQRWSKRA